jgi:predicted Kef-type K+ transport protein
MTSRIHFKLKNALDKKSVAFDGAVIQVGDIKRLIAEQLGTWDSLAGVIHGSPGQLICSLTHPRFLG